MLESYARNIEPNIHFLYKVPILLYLILFIFDVQHAQLHGLSTDCDKPLPAYYCVLQILKSGQKIQHDTNSNKNISKTMNALIIFM